MDGEVLDYEEPSYKLLFPVMDNYSPVTWAPEDQPMWVHGEDRCNYYLCSDGKYRTIEHRDAVYQCTEKEGSIYRFVGYEGQEAKEYHGCVCGADEGPIETRLPHKTWCPGCYD